MYEITIKPLSDLVDLNEWEEFSEMAVYLAKNVKGCFIVDMANVGRIASNYIGTLISAHKQIAPGAKVKLINVRPRLYELFGVLRMTEMFEVEPNFL